MGRRTVTLLATLVAVLATSGAAQAAKHERYVHPPSHASINSSDSVPMEVTPSDFVTLTTAVAERHWDLQIDGATMAPPGARDGVNSIGFTSGLPRDVLGAYIYWPRRVYKSTKVCKRKHGKRVCRRVKRYRYTEIKEADVGFSTAFYWNEGPSYPVGEEIDLPTVEIHELGHFDDPNKPHGKRCSGSPLTESLGFGEWWRARDDWYEEECSNSPAKRARRAAVPLPPEPIFQRIAHPLPDRVI
ncbi:MAG: hypothetical protein QOH76_3440 [Thermoleophilaceae bacterium]|jgi:hypothetical protein|nr:hypothetical protein [Thermoleophilaceae bacterium]